ncbi:MAG: response regulator [Betaproteobacteria bacterium]
MIVCDTAVDKSVLQDVLADLAEVSFGDSGEQGVRNAQAWQPDLMVLGARLADMDGAQTLGALKKDRRTSGIPVLLMADRGDADAESRLLLQGATDVLHTPLRAEAVRSRIQLHLNLARRARQLHAFEQKDQHMQKASELLDDLLATSKMVAKHVADGLPVEPHLARWLATGQQLKRMLAPGRKAGAGPSKQDQAAAVQPPPSRAASPAAAPQSSAKTETPPPAAPPGEALGEDHLWLPLDPQDPAAR